MTLLLLYHLISFFQSDLDVSLPPQLLFFLTTTLSQWTWTQTFMKSSYTSSWLLPKTGTPTSTLTPTPSIPLEVVEVPLSLTLLTLFVVLFIMFATIILRLSSSRKSCHTGLPLGAATSSVELVITDSLSPLSSPDARSHLKQLHLDQNMPHVQANVSSTTLLRPDSWCNRILRASSVFAQSIHCIVSTSVIELHLAYGMKFIQRTVPTIEPILGSLATTSIIQCSWIWRLTACDTISCVFSWMNLEHSFLTSTESVVSHFWRLIISLIDWTRGLLTGMMLKTSSLISSLSIKVSGFTSLLSVFIWTRVVPIVPPFSAIFWILSNEASFKYMISVFQGECSSILLSITVPLWRTFFVLLFNQDIFVRYLFHCFCALAAASVTLNTSAYVNALSGSYCPSFRIQLLVLFLIAYLVVDTAVFDRFLLCRQQIITRRLQVHRDGRCTRETRVHFRYRPISDVILVLLALEIIMDVAPSLLVLEDPLLGYPFIFITIIRLIVCCIRCHFWSHSPSFQRRLEVHNQLAEVVIDPFPLFLGRQVEPNHRPAARPVFSYVYDISKASRDSVVKLFKVNLKVVQGIG